MREGVCTQRLHTSENAGRANMKPAYNGSQLNVKVVSFPSVLFLCRLILKYLLDFYDCLIKSIATQSLHSSDLPFWNWKCSGRLGIQIVVLISNALGQLRISWPAHHWQIVAHMDHIQCWVETRELSFQRWDRQFCFGKKRKSIETWQQVSVYLRKVKLNVGDLALKFECPSRFHSSIFGTNTFKIQLLCTYCSNDKDSLPCRGELLTSVKYFLVASPNS